jgi:leucyl aminopeptidase
VALGRSAGLLGNSDKLATPCWPWPGGGRPAWRPPLDEDYAELIKSPFADVANVAGMRGRSPLSFLARFVGKTDWAHFDTPAA